MFQLNAPFVYYIYQLPLHVSSNIVLIIRRIHCIHTASGSLYVTNGALSWNIKSNITKMHGQQYIKNQSQSCMIIFQIKKNISLFCVIFLSYGTKMLNTRYKSLKSVIIQVSENPV